MEFGIAEHIVALAVYTGLVLAVSKYLWKAIAKRAAKEGEELSEDIEG